MAYLVLVRHGQSEWNALGKWTGWQDVPLTDQGKQEAREAAKSLEGLTFDKAYTSNLSRAQQTLAEIMDHLQHVQLETVPHEALNERHYGDYTGMNKWDAKEKMGEEEFTKLRRSWDHPVPNGETLKDVHDRAIPFYEQHIREDLKSGKNIIVAAHGNTLRALVKYLESVPDDQVHTVEIGTGEVYMYTISEDGDIREKTIFNGGNKA
ncbi:MAG TPA: 2,3-diphosphoglycerate-dependent phosphoglycerate mutase [Candidatus Saccharimonadales bacterium]|nr:2,3-diphosphoglycerate-dependent phosphoglycerate mutase [Candidatus Saccharimonadales bacterium]